MKSSHPNPCCDASIQAAVRVRDVVSLAAWLDRGAAATFGGCLVNCPIAIIPRLDGRESVLNSPPTAGFSVLNSVDAGRRLMLRAAIYPLLAVAVVSLAFLLLGPKYAMGAAATGLATVVGGWLAARTALSGGVQAAGAAMARLIVAMVLKWVLIFAVLALGFAWWRLPPLALLTGIAVGLMFQVLALARR